MIMDTSVVICTYNRAESLKKTLSALASMIIPSGHSWEVVVVDNNSQDDTKIVVKNARLMLPVIRYEFEAKQGLSFARNLGIKKSHGEIILFTDDDVCPEPDWLVKTTNNIKQFGCDACGGYIAPSWEVDPPNWLTERFYGFLAIKTDNDCYPIYSGNSLPFGANMAFKRDVFDQVGLFDVTRGRKGAVLASGEDGELFQRLLAAKMKVMYFPDSKVHHNIEAFRVRKSYFRRWRFQTSKNIAESKNIVGDRRLLGVPLYLFPQLLRAAKNMLVSKAVDPADEAFNKEIIFWHFLGTISGLYQVRQGLSLERTNS